MKKEVGRGEGEEIYVREKRKKRRSEGKDAQVGDKIREVVGRRGK